MILFQKLTRSSIGRKILMASTGVLLMGFLIGHMLGNLQILMGPDALNSYAEHLQNLGPFLWFIRIGLLAVFLIHVMVSISLKRENLKARPVGYRYASTVKATISSRSMIWSGAMIFFFLLYHLLHFTMGVVPTSAYALQDSMGRHDVYRMVVENFRILPITAVYLIAVGLLALHLRHALQSAFQTLGFFAEGGRNGSQRFSFWFSIVIFIGYAAVPLSAALHIVKLSGEV